jgi:HEAT repeat protein
MSGLASEFRTYYDQLKRGQVENALCALSGASHAILPHIERAYRAELDPGLRALLVEAAWEHRIPEVVAFLAEALDDPEPVVWKEALDGLVVIATPEARAALVEVLEPRAATRKNMADFRAWVREAIDQIDHGMLPGDQTQDRSPNPPCSETAGM